MRFLFAFLFFSIQSLVAQVEIYHVNDPSTDLTGQEIVVTGNPSDNQVKALLFLKNTASFFQEYFVVRERVFATSNEDFLCIGELCLENSNPSLDTYQFPVPFQLASEQSSQFEPGFFPDNQNVCGIQKYFILDDKNTKVDSIQVKFLIGVENCNLNTADETSMDVSNVNLYPNPAKNSFTVNLGGDFQGKIVLQDALGKIVLEKNLSKKQTFDISGLQNGLYFATIYQGEGQNVMLTKRLVVKK